MGNATGFSINSFVFLDFETSHLLSKDHPKIIELSLIAVNRNGLLNSDVHTALNCARKENFTFDLSKVSLPRIIDKLTLCVDPRKYTSPQSARITKLDKRNLDKNKKLPFDEDVICMLNLFLSRQEAPVCLVAHNGLRFDFAILRSELSQLTTGDLSAELYCVDSLSGFRAGFTTEKQGETKQREGKNKQEPTWMPSPEPDLSLERKLPDCDNSTGMAFQQSQKRGLGDLGSYPSPSFSGATVQDSTGTMPRSYSHASDNLLTPYPLLSQSKQPLKPYTDQLKEKTPKPTHRHSATDVTYKWKVASPPSSLHNSRKHIRRRATLKAIL